MIKHFHHDNVRKKDYFFGLIVRNLNALVQTVQTLNSVELGVENCVVPVMMKRKIHTSGISLSHENEMPRLNEVKIGVNICISSNPT